MLPSALLLTVFWVLSALAWVGLTIFIFRRPNTSRKSAAQIIMSVSVLLHLGLLAMPGPSLSDDLWRYLYDGEVLVQGSNPYQFSPSETLGQSKDERLQWLSRINNPELVTIYQPISQYVFAGLTWVQELIWYDPPQLGERQFFFRAAFSMINLMVVGLLLLRLAFSGRSLWWAVLYAWHPLVISEVAWSGHQDVLGLILMLCALLLGQAAGRSWWAAFGAGLALALAIGVKPIVLPLALPLAWSLRQHPMRVVAAAGITCLGLAMIYLPFAIMQGGLSRMFETSRYFVEVWRFNGSIHAWLEFAIGNKRVTDTLTGALLFIILLASTGLQKSPWRASLTYLFAGLCLSSTVHPWYLLWSLALLPIAWSTATTVVAPAVWIASLTLPWSYAAWRQLARDGEFALTLPLRIAIWLPIFMGLFVGIGWVWRDRRRLPAP